MPEIPSSLSTDGGDAVFTAPATPSEDLVNVDVPSSSGEDLAAPDAPPSSGKDPVVVAAPPALVTLSPSATVARMAELFPALFGPGVFKPLKLRVQVDVQQRAPNTFTKKALSLFLQRHTTTTAYLKALSQAAERVDLDGQPAGPVSDEHREAAVAELQRRRALVQERRAAEQQAQRQRSPRPPRSAPAQGFAESAAGAPVVAEDGAPQPDPAVAQAQPPQGVRPGERQREHRQQPPQQRHNPQRPEQRREPRRAGRPPDQAQRHPHQPLGEPLHGQPPHGQPRAQPLDPERQRELAAEARAAGERAALLRAFESTTLTRANFCALKRLPEAELEAALVLARQDRQLRGSQSPPPDPEQHFHATRPGGHRPGSGPGPRADARGPRPPSGNRSKPGR